MELAERQKYLKKIQDAFIMDPIFELTLDKFDHLEGYDREIELAKLFIPEIEKAGPYDIRYDLAITMVYMLASPEERPLILKHLCEHYNILKFFPWNLDCLKDWLYSEEYYYHPSLAMQIFSHPARPMPRIEDFTQLLNTIRIFDFLNYEQFETIIYYYAWYSEGFQISTTEIDILNAVFPHYTRNVEEINIYLEYLYKGENLSTTPKYIRELVSKLGRDYKTIKKHLDQLKSGGLLHQILWLDNYYQGMESLLFIIPGEYKLRIKPSYFYRKYELKPSDNNLSLLTTLLPRGYGNRMQKYIERSIKKPVKAYDTFTIPIPPYSFKFFNTSKNKIILDWDVVYNHLKSCKLQKNESEYVPLRVQKSEVDILKLKMIDITKSNVSHPDSHLQKILNAPLYKIREYRKDIIRHGIQFPYIMSPDLPELYIFKANISTIGEVNYCIDLVSLFPSVTYHWCQDIYDSKEHVLICFIHLPTGSHRIFDIFGKNQFPFEYQLYYGPILSYNLSFRHWELFNEDKNEFNYDLNNFKIYATN